MKFSILIEGEPTEEFTRGRGLKQRNPLSLLIFILLMENLSQALHDAAKNKEIDTYKLKGIDLISHLFFTSLQTTCYAL